MRNLSLWFHSLTSVLHSTHLTILFSSSALKWVLVSKEMYLPGLLLMFQVAFNLLLFLVICLTSVPFCTEYHKALYLGRFCSYYILNHSLMLLVSKIVPFATMLMISLNIFINILKRSWKTKMSPQDFQYQIFSDHHIQWHHHSGEEQAINTCKVKGEKPLQTLNIVSILRHSLS